MKKFTFLNIIIGCIMVLGTGTTFSQSQAALDFAAKENISVTQVQEIGEFSLIDNHITVSQTWNGIDAILNSNLVIDAGVELIIRNSIIGIQAEHYITVLPGGKLTLENTRLTSSSLGLPGRWMSVFVGGNPNSTLPSDQGLLTMTNSTVENAHIGIYNYVVQNGGSIMNTHGGLVYASNCRFINNRYDVILNAPVYAGQSFFYKCLFELTSAQCIVNDANNYRVGLTNTRNTVFAGCTFRSMIGSTIAVTYGISAYGAKFYVDDYCDCFLPVYPCPESCKLKSSFSNFDYGIYAEAGNNIAVKPGPSVLIRNSTFYGNRIGATKLIGMYYPDFSNCTVSIPSDGGRFGLYLDNCRLYKIQNNTFQPTLFTSMYRNNIGLIVRNSGSGAHQIYRNNFQDLHIGIEALEDNSGSDNYVDGLKMNCNVFDRGDYDIYMSSRYINGASVAYHQGDPNVLGVRGLVRNQYGAICGNGNKWYIEGSRKIIYHPCTRGESTSPTPQPWCSSTLLDVAEFEVRNHIEPCPNEFNLLTLQELDAQIALTNKSLSDLAFQGITDIATANEILQRYEDGEMNDGVKEAMEFAAFHYELQSLVNEKIRRNLELGTTAGDLAAKALIETHSFVLEEAMDVNPVSTQRQQLEKELKNATADTHEALQHQLLTLNSPEEIVLPGNAKKMDNKSTLNSIEKEGKFSMYPNPAQNNITFNYTGETEGIMTIEIMDVTGRLIKNIEFNGHQLHISVMDLPESVYFATLKINGIATETHKLVLNK